MITDLLNQAGLRSGDPVLEIGAGTGQLTGAPLAAGLQVHALEPGANMAARLRSSFAGSDGLQVAEVLFEDFDAHGRRFRGVVSANAFHWVDPTVSYAKGADVLDPGGSLCLSWMFPIFADADVQRRLNDETPVDDLADMARDPDQFVDQLHDLLGEGRAEVVASGHFEEPWWAIYDEQLAWSVDDYVRLLTSQANGVGVGHLIDRRIRAALDDAQPLRITNHIYLGVARRLDEPALRSGASN